MADLSTRYLGWCPVCERDIKVRSRLLVHHGYVRPGVGYIIGDCPGVGHEPYELGTGACDFYLNIVLTKIRNATATLRTLRQPEGPPNLSFEDYNIETRRVSRDSMGHPNLIFLTHAEADALAAQLPRWDLDRYDWDRRLRIAIANVESDLYHWEKERRRIEGLIANWNLQPLRTLEEEIQHKEQKRAERDTALQVARDQKISDEVVKIRKRIDSAVRNKNASTLADIYSSNKLRELSRWELTREGALDLLERNSVWLSFGLRTPSGYLEGDAAEVILDEMKWGVKALRADRGYDRRALPWPTELGGGFAKIPNVHL